MGTQDLFSRLIKKNKLALRSMLKSPYYAILNVPYFVSEVPTKGVQAAKIKNNGNTLQ